MKVKFLSVATIVAFFIASCGGVDKGLVDNITKFETDWTAMVTDVNSMSDKMTTAAAETTKECDEMCSTESKDKKMQAALDSCKMACTASKEGMNQAVVNINTIKEDLVKATADFNAWKEKVMKGEIKDEEATKALEGYNTAMAMKKEDVKALNEAFELTMSECKSSCGAKKECCEKK